MLGLKLNHVSKRGPWPQWVNPFVRGRIQLPAPYQCVVITVQKINEHFNFCESGARRDIDELSCPEITYPFKASLDCLMALRTSKRMVINGDIGKDASDG